MATIKKRVVIETKKVSTCIDNLNASLGKRNSRLVHKYTSQLQELLDTALDARVDAELDDNIDKEDQWMVEACRIDEAGQFCLVKGNEYLLECEKVEEASILQKVTNAKIEELPLYLLPLRTV